jgi:DNA polymerase
MAKISLEEYPSAEAFMPAKVTLPALKEAAAGCKGCPLYKIGTQTVFGEGPVGAKVMFVGEQPGDQEDLAGKPFVGPAGGILNKALEEAGIDRSEVYVTNAVKHFKWEPRGKRRLHSKPNAREIQACKPWLTAEIQVVQPQMVVALGATAAQALMGKDFRVTQSRGKVFRDTQWAPWFGATVHPSSILRAPDDQREAAYRAFVSDMRAIAKAIKEETAGRAAAARPRPAAQAQTQMALFGSEDKQEKAHPDRRAGGRGRARKTR